ncbi:MAG: hypothetical protein U0470_12340 [Anaerolineae bacterium]
MADDFEFERKMAMMNRHLAPNIETMLLIADPAHVRQRVDRARGRAHGRRRQPLVPPGVQTALDAKRRSELAVEAGDEGAVRDAHRRRATAAAVIAPSAPAGDHRYPTSPDRPA